MTDEENRPALTVNLFHLTDTFLLKFAVADGKHFVDHKNFRIQMRRYCERKTDIHSTGVSLYRRINEFLHSGKINYLIKLRANLGLGHPQNRAVEKNVFASGQFRVKARAYFQQTGDASLHPHFPACRRSHTRENLQHRALPRAVPANDPENFPLLDLERHLAKSPDFVLAQ